MRDYAFHVADEAVVGAADLSLSKAELLNNSNELKSTLTSEASIKVLLAVEKDIEQVVSKSNGWANTPAFKSMNKSLLLSTQKMFATVNYHAAKESMTKQELRISNQQLVINRMATHFAIASLSEEDKVQMNQVNNLASMFEKNLRQIVLLSDKNDITLSTLKVVSDKWGTLASERMDLVHGTMDVREVYNQVAEINELLSEALSQCSKVEN